MNIKKLITGGLVGTVLLGVLPTIAIGKSIPQVVQNVHVGAINEEINFKVFNDGVNFSKSFKETSLHDAGAIEVKGKLTVHTTHKTSEKEIHEHVVLQN